MTGGRQVMDVLAAKVRLDRALLGFVLASVVVFAGLGVNEVTGDQWGMVRTLGQYQSVLVAVLTASLLAQEFERGTITWALTQGYGRSRWLVWRMWLPALVVLAGSLGLGVVMAVVHGLAPAVWLNGLPAGALSSLSWQWPVGAGLVAVGLGVLAALATRRVAPAVSIAGPAMVVANVVVDAVRDRAVDAGDSLAVTAWTGLGVQLLAAALLVLVAGRLLERVDL